MDDISRNLCKHFLKAFSTFTPTNQVTKLGITVNKKLLLLNMNYCLNKSYLYSF